jgi:MtN3 and saliva related transmembrane protein
MSQILGWIATIMLTTYAIPQIVKIFKRKSVEDISIWMWWLYLIGHLVALVYAIMINQFPLIFKYIVSMAISLVVIIFYYEYNNTN